MAANILEIDTGVVARIKDAAQVLTQDERKAHIQSAVGEYQQARPRKLVVALVGTGAYEYDVTALSGWIDGFSRIDAVHGPVLSGQSVTPPRLRPQSWMLTRVPAGPRLRFLDRLPSSVDTYHVHHTGAHTVNDTTCTVWPTDDEAVKDLAAHYCCLALAAYYEQETDSTIEADTVDRSGKSESYRSMARSYRAGYDAKLPKAPATAGYFERLVG